MSSPAPPQLVCCDMHSQQLHKVCKMLTRSQLEVIIPRQLVYKEPLKVIKREDRGEINRRTGQREATPDRPERAGQGGQVGEIVYPFYNCCLEEIKPFG